MTRSKHRLRLGVLVSGGGRSLQNLVERSRAGDLAAEVAVVISNSAKAYALERAEKLGIPSVCISPGSFDSQDEFAAAIYRTLDEADVDLALLAGYLVRLPVADHWHGRIMNIHPALLPMFGGKGFYGHHVHDAVRAAGWQGPGCTVHFVDDQYDHGPIILQRTVPVQFEDSSDEIADRVFAEEKIALPAAVNLFAQERLRILDGKVRVLA